MEFKTTYIGRNLIQAGVPKIMRPKYGVTQANGLLLRGVVTATYVVDDDGHPQADNDPVATYCDVMTYSNRSGQRIRFLQQVLVSQNHGGIHDGPIRRPRAASIDVAENTFDVERGTNPASMDGDHVLVGFIDDNLNEPVILHSLPHPAADIGSSSSSIRRTLKLKKVDGDPSLLKHHGSFYGIETDGSFCVDTRFANDGELDDKGKEKDPPTDGSGTQINNLPIDAFQQVNLFDMSNPDSPELKIQISVDQNQWKVQFVDDKTVIRVEPDKITVDVEDGANPVVVTNGKIELGGTGDKAVLDSLAQAEWDKIRAEMNVKLDAIAKMRFPLNYAPAALLVNPVAPVVLVTKTPIVYGDGTFNVASVDGISGQDAQPGNAPIDDQAEEFVQPKIPPELFTDPPRDSGLFPDAEAVGKTSSDLVTIDK